MASGIKGITVEIGGDTTKLDKALAGVNKTSRNLQAELRQVDKLLKLDPTNTELLAQKQEILKQSIAATSEKLDVLKEAEKQVQAQFEKGEVSEEQYRALQREIIKCSNELDGLQEASKQTNKAMKGMKDSTEETGEELGKAEEEAKDFGESLGALSEKGKAATAAIGTGLVAAGTYATKFEADCDRALNTLITQTGAADDEVEGLEDTLLNIYKNNFGEDINDVAVAMSAVKQQTGLANEELQSTTEAALLMRDTFDIDVNEGVRGVTAMMKQFGISAEEAYNLMAQGVQKGLNQNEDLADQMAEYAVYYADMGFSAEEMFNMIANGAKDGTFQIDYLNDAVKEFGIRVKDGTADDTFKELGLNAKKLKKQFAEGGESARKAFDTVNNALFSCENEVQRNIMGVSMYGTKWEDLGEDAIRSLTNTQGEISSTRDALSEINETKYDDLGNQFEELGRNLKTDLVKPIGEELKPVVGEAIDTVKKNIPEVKKVLFAVISKVKEFISFLSQNGSTIILIIADIAAGLLAWNVVSMIQGLVSSIKKWSAATEGASIAQKLLNAAMAANPVGIIIVAITTLIALFVALYEKCDWFREAVNSIIEAVRPYVEQAITSLKAAIEAIWTKAQEIWTAIQPYLIEAWEEVKRVFATAWEYIKMVWDAVAPYFQILWEVIKAIFSVVIDVLGAYFRMAWEVIKAIWDAAAPFFKALWETIKVVFSVVSDVLGRYFKVAWEIIQAVWDKVGPYFMALWEAIKFVFSVVSEVLGGFFSAAWEWIKTVWNAASAYFQTIFEYIKAVFSVVGEVLGGFFEVAWEYIKAVWNTVSSYFSTIWETIKGIFSVVGSVLSGNFSEAWEKIKKIFASWGKFFGGLWDSIKSVFGSVADWFKNIFTKAWEGVKNVFSTGGKIFDGIKDGIANVFKTVVNGIIGGINKVISVPFKAINKMLNKIRSISILDFKPFDWIKKDLLDIPEIPKLAKGGQLSNGRAIVAEAGPELISMVNGKTIVTPLTNSARNTALEGIGGDEPQKGGFVQNNYYTSPKALSPGECARQTRNATRNMVLRLQGGT